MLIVKRIAGVLLLALVALAAALGFNTWRMPSRQVGVVPMQKVAVDAQAVAERLAGAVRFKTISSLDDPQANAAEFDKLHAYLREKFPALHGAMRLEEPGAHALIYVWPGSDPQLPPVALMAHQDVVPIASGTEDKWQAEPFGGVVKDGYVWGRGAWDNKGNLLAQMEALELLARAGFKPQRTLYLISGADEEIGGHRGAERIAQRLKEGGVHLAWVLDEGLLVTEGMTPGLTRPAALVGVAEKGYASYRLTLDAAPGHSSMPPLHGSAIGVMGGALARLEAQQFPATLGGSVAGRMFDTLAPEMAGFNRVALSNLWLFGPVVRKQLEASPAGNAMLRTTTALTIVAGGNKDNVMPGHVEATVNFRVLPGDTLAAVEAHVRQAVGNEAIQVQPYPGNAEPSPVSSTDGIGYATIQQAIRQVFPDGVVAPGLMLGATDGRHLGGVADAVYRFSPVRARADDLPRFHGTNERISVDNYVEMIRFYHQLLSHAGRPGASPG